MSQFYEQGSSQGLQLFHVDSSDIIWKMPDSLGSGYIQEIELDEGLSLVIIDNETKQNLIKDIQDSCLYHTSLEFEFHLIGIAAGISEIKLHLGNSGTYQIQVHPRCCLVEVFVTPPKLERYFHCLLGQMPLKLRQIGEKFFEQIHYYTFSNYAITKQLAISEVLNNTAIPSMPSAISKVTGSMLTPEVWLEFQQVLRSKITPAMQEVINQILNCSYQGTMRQIYLESKALELVTLRLEQIAQTNQQIIQPRLLRSADVEKICQARDILLQYMHKPPSLITLARQVGLNDCTLKRGFRQVFGMTAYDYLYHYRMERSQKLLQTGQMSVNQVAGAVGYASRSSFYKAFMKKFGVSPRQYLNSESKNSA